jgi:hypothetical protein
MARLRSELYAEFHVIETQHKLLNQKETMDEEERLNQERM